LEVRRILVVQNNRLTALNHLGLTILQAKVYVALTELGQATAKKIAQIAHEDRAEVYRTISKLQKLGLVEKIITAPTIFAAIPMKEGLHILLERKTHEYGEVIAETNELLQQIRKPKDEKMMKGESKYILIPEKEASAHRFIKELRNAQTSYDCIYTCGDYRNRLSRVAENFKRPLKKGVKIRFLTYKPESGKTMLETVQTLKKSGSFEVRYIPKFTEGQFGMIDKKEVFISTSVAPYDATAVPNIWSNNPNLLAIIQNYFELMWRTSTETDPKYRQAPSDNILKNLCELKIRCLE
jgi:sugar-specific transcriptional regulator TrmB